jgi:TM2 domain-containing membrane protein YozV
MNPVCPYCNVEIDLTGTNRVFCTSCGAAHHADCWQENGGCTVFGCAAAPPDDSKVTVTPSDLTAIPPPPPGAPWPQPGAYLPPAQAKSHLAYILLGIFLGAFGVHNFYAGYTARAVVQLCITLCTCCIGAIVPWVWAIVEICTVDRDSHNIPMV